MAKLVMGTRLLVGQYTRVIPRFHPGYLLALSAAHIPQHHFHSSRSVLKDKPNNATKGEPKKSRFLKLDEDGNEIKPEKKQRTVDDMFKIEAARKEREAKKKETRFKQIEIQKKREAAKKGPK